MNQLTDLSGTLTPLTTTGSVEITSMELDAQSERKLLNVVTEQRVRGENQDLHFREISINKAHADLFRRGQSGWNQEGNVYTMPVSAGTPLRFRAELKALIVDNQHFESLHHIHLGNIAFDLSRATWEDYGDEVVFENASAMLYPTGRYNIQPIK